VSFLGITIPATLLLAVTLLWLVVRAARRGEFEDPEGPAMRMLWDDDESPERPASLTPERPSTNEEELDR
jgi:cbb3-type cytochrome oxidase maturation protein